MCNAPRALGVTVDGGYATHVLVPHPRYLLDVEGIAPEIAGPLMCSGLTGYGAIKKAVPYLRVGPAADRRPGRRRHDGAAVRPRADRQADLRGRHRRGQARGGPEARRQGGLRSGRRRRPQGHRQGLGRRRGRGSRFRRLRQVAGLRAGRGGQGRCGHRGRPDRRQLHAAGADVPPARADRHGQLRRLARRRRAR